MGHPCRMLCLDHHLFFKWKNRPFNQTPTHPWYGKRVRQSHPTNFIQKKVFNIFDQGWSFLVYLSWLSLPFDTCRLKHFSRKTESIDVSGSRVDVHIHHMSIWSSTWPINNGPHTALADWLKDSVSHFSVCLGRTVNELVWMSEAVMRIASHGR